MRALMRALGVAVSRQMRDAYDGARQQQVSGTFPALSTPTRKPKKTGKR